MASERHATRGCVVTAGSLELRTGNNEEKEDSHYAELVLHLYVTGPEADMVAFEEKARGPKGLLDANSFVPYPEKFRQMDEEHPGLYMAWRCHRKSACRVPRPDGRVPREVWHGQRWLHLGGSVVGAQLGNEMESGTVRQVSRRRRHRSYNFSAAWSPSVPLVAAMAAPSRLRFKLRYFEGAMRFQGTFEIQGTEISRNECREYGGGRGG